MVITNIVPAMSIGDCSGGKICSPRVVWETRDEPLPFPLRDKAAGRFRSFLELRRPLGGAGKTGSGPELRDRGEFRRLPVEVFGSGKHVDS